GTVSRMALDPYLPKSKPFLSLSEIAEWKPGIDPFNVSSICLRRRPEIPVDIQQLMFTEMIALYRASIEQIFILSKIGATLTYLSVNFSHYRGTIPPACWTNAAHRNGVQMLANFITEWGPGISENLLLIYGPEFDSSLPGNGDLERKDGTFSTFFADKLIDMAEYYGFDGWFFNIEATVPSSVDARNLVLFLEYMMKKLHERIPGSILIWYDSLTINGDLDWQNYLNPLNLAFFLATDGIYTNYGWSSDKPFLSAHLAKLAKRSVTASEVVEIAADSITNLKIKLGIDKPDIKDMNIAVQKAIEDLLNQKNQNIVQDVKFGRPASRDVWTGTDVYGRGTFGGGGFNCHKAFRVSEEALTSAALFGQAWAYDKIWLDCGVDFRDGEKRFWDDKSHVIGEARYGIGKEESGQPGAVDERDIGCVYDAFSYRIYPGISLNNHNDFTCNSAFYTNFDRGYGIRYYIEGKLVSSQNWTNISRQQLLPSRNMLKNWISVPIPNNCDSLITGTNYFCDLDNDISYFGGASLKISLQNLESLFSNTFEIFNLFDVRIHISEKTKLEMRYLKTESVNIGFSIALLIKIEGEDEFVENIIAFDSDNSIEGNEWFNFSWEIGKLITSDFPLKNWEVTLLRIGIATSASELLDHVFRNVDIESGSINLKSNDHLSSNISNMICRIGELKVLPWSRPSKSSGSLFSPRPLAEIRFTDPFKCMDPENEDISLLYVTVEWDDVSGYAPLEFRTILWEIYLDEEWAGSAFVTRFRVGPTKENLANVRVVGYDELGNRTSELEAFFDSTTI
ncbi:hypothetical protein HK096_003536, partial [Nowakowskiella sp. JEL0078]